jgi:uncharacterized membrane protein YeaQ/YmgE (transglycosylase-associated protein family)
MAITVMPREQEGPAASASEAAPTPDPPMAGDGTRQLLQGGFWTLVAGVVAAFATQVLFGGIGIHGPHTNAGWISLMVALMCLPFGSLLFLLGGAKWVRNRRLRVGGQGREGRR